MEWRNFEDHSHGDIAQYEAWFESLIPAVRAQQLGEIDDLIDAAALGELEDSGDAATPIKPIRLDPEVFELRRRALSKKLRFYHGEPARLPSVLVALHHHIKTNDGQQEEAIKQAVGQYAKGESCDWE